MSLRDGFTQKTRETIAQRAGYRCSEPDCGRPTRGAASDPDNAIDIGVAAHITAAAPGGPRYDPGLTVEQRRHSNNGIWLCSNHASLIDRDVSAHPKKLLQNWKKKSEKRSFLEVCGHELGFRDAISSDDKDIQSAFNTLLNYSSSDIDAFQRSSAWPSHPISLNLRLTDYDSNTSLTVSGLVSGLGRFEQVAVIAPPGTGKTTTLLQLAEAALANKAFISAFIPLSEWATGSGSFLAELLMRTAFKDVSQGQFELLAQHGKLLLVLDGWNELSETSRQRACGELSRLRRDYPDLRVVISSRQKGADLPIDGPVLEIKPLTEDQQLELAESIRGTEGVSLIEQAWRTPGLKGLVSISLYLSALLKQLPDGTLPTTKEEVLRFFVDELERDRAKAAPLREVLQGFHRDFLEALAVEATRNNTVALSDTQARATVTDVQKRLQAEGQISGMRQPMNVLDTLVNAHLLVRPGGEVDGVSFQHQQFQEWFSSLRVRQLMLSASKGDEYARRTLRNSILNLPVWEEALLFACEHLSRTDEDGVNAVGYTIMSALEIDPLLSAEMIWRSSDDVWSHIREDVVSFIRKWHAPGHVDRAVHFMICTGNPEFSELVWPLVSNADDQVHLAALRAGQEFRPSVLGQDVDRRVATLPKSIRRNIILEIAENSGMDGIELATSLAKADSDSEIKSLVAEALIFRRADRSARELLQSSSDEVWQALAERWPPSEFADPFISERIQLEADKIFARGTNPERSLARIVRTNTHDPGMKQTVRTLIETIDFSDNSRNLTWEVHRAHELYPDEVVTGLLASLERGGQVPGGTDEIFRMSDVIIDDGPLADRVKDLTSDISATEAIACIIGQNTIGYLIDQLLAAYVRGQGDGARYDKEHRYERHRLLDIISATGAELFAAAVLERSMTKDLDKINALADLVFRHSCGVDGERLNLAPRTCKRITLAVKRWAEVLLASPDGTRAQLATVAQAAGRLASAELVPVLLRLLSEDLSRRRQAREAQRQGHISTDAYMDRSNQYRNAFAAIGDKQTNNAMKAYLRDPEFGVEAAHVLKSAQKDTSGPTERKSDLSAPWPNFSTIPEACRKRQSGEIDKTHPFFDEIISVINEITIPGASESDLDFALNLAKVAFSMPYVEGGDTIETLLQLPVPAEKKRGLLTVLLLSGEPISAELVLQGIYELLDRTKTNQWMSQDGFRLRMVDWLQLLPFTDKPIAILDVLEQADGFPATPLNLRPVLTALRYAPSDEAETVLHELARRDERFLGEGGWVAALAARDTLSAARLLLDNICSARFSENGKYFLGSYYDRYLSALIVSHDQFRRDVYRRYSSLDVGPVKSLLAYVIATAPDVEGVMLLVHDCVANDKSFLSSSIEKALHGAFVNRVPAEPEGMWNLYRVPAPEIRRQLIDMVANGCIKEKRLAVKCLNIIDEIRDEYGYVDSEPRHPDIDAGVPWPLLDVE